MEINKAYPCNDTNYSLRTKNKIEYIVIHYVGASGSALQNAKYFSTREYIGASCHFFVGHASEGGAVYQSVDPKYRAWHCGSETGKYYNDCRNENSIGVELCCHKDANGNWYFDEMTLSSAQMLVRELMAKYGIPIERVVRHYDVTKKCCPAPFVYNEAAWQEFKRKIAIGEFTLAEDIVRELSARGLVLDTQGMIGEMKSDLDGRLYWIARKALQYIRERE